MIAAAEKFDTDMVLMNFYKRFPLGVFRRRKNFVDKYNSLITREEIMRDYYLSCFVYSKFHPAYWGKLIRTEIVRKSEFKYDSPPLGEDQLHNGYIFPLLRSMVFIDYLGYNWRFGGISSPKDMTLEEAKQVVSDYVEVYRTQLRLAEKTNFKQAYRPLIKKLVYSIFDILSVIAKYRETDSTSRPIKEMIQEILDIDYYQDNISKFLHDGCYAKNAYIMAVRKRDVDAVYKMCHNRYRKNWKFRLSCQLLHKLKTFI